MSTDDVIEFDCVDCGMHIIAVALTKVPEPPLCGVCIHLPHWFDDPVLAKMLDPEHWRTVK